MLLAYRHEEGARSTEETLGPVESFMLRLMVRAAHGQIIALGLPYEQGRATSVRVHTGPRRGRAAVFRIRLPRRCRATWAYACSA